MTLQESVDDIRAKLASFISGGESKLSEFTSKIAELTASIGDSAAKITQLEADLATAKQTIGTLTKERDDASAASTAKDKKISDLEASQTEFDKRVSEKATQLLASNGIPTGKLPGTSEKSDESAELASIRSQLATETDPVKRSQLAQKARELRGHSDLFKTESK
jgi:chromosome segregation ATPase